MFKPKMKGGKIVSANMHDSSQWDMHAQALAIMAMVYTSEWHHHDGLLSGILSLPTHGRITVRGLF